MIIILEGIDGSGKTTLGKEIEQRTNIPLYTRESTPLEGQTLESSNGQTLGALEMAMKTNADVMFDRSFPSEWVYSRVKGRVQNDIQVAAIDLIAGKYINCYGILMRYEDMGDAWNRNDDHVDADELMLADRLYFEYIEKSRMKWLLLEASDPVKVNVEKVMDVIIRERRPSKEEVYMRLAFDVSKLSTCLSRRTGAVLLSADGHVIATGYNGAPKGCEHMKTCPRLVNDVASGEGLDMCNDVHAEENCIAQAAIHGASTKGSTIHTTMSPCHRCARMLINAGVRRVVFRREYGDTRALDMFNEAGVDWVASG